ncbi:MAG: HNH endonuclease [Parachlamydia sp.]|nr:HNH endonuclease [Parachlamydia sp.]
MITEKQCAYCKQNLPLSEFYFRLNRKNNQYYSYCRKCTSIITVKRLQNNKRIAVDYKGGKCSICGYNKCIDCLDFHHIDPDEKDFCISQHKGMLLENIKHELDKCILVCRNCHGEIHNKENI